MVTDGTAMVRFEDVGLTYGRGGQGADVLHDLNFALPEGGFRWLLGPSGAGKTSLLRLMYLAVRPTQGRLTVLGTDVGAARRRALPRLRRRIGVVFQDFRLLAHLSAFDNVALPLRLSGRPVQARRGAPGSDVGRRAAARGDRPRGGGPAAPAAGRRADRQP
jgi:cell division transport system ATP-binding protein